MKKSSKIIMSLLVASMVMMLAGCGSDNDKIKVKVANAKMGEIEANFSINGALVPIQSADLSAAFMGKVIALNVGEGDLVTKGQVLAKLDDAQLNAQLRQATANYQGTQNTQVQAKITLDNALKTLERTKSLYADGAVAKIQLEADQKSYDLAKSQYDSSVTSGGSGAKASVDSINLQIQNATIKSPISGVVLNKNISIGETATLGSPLFTIADMSTLKLKGMVPQESLPYIKKGDLVDLSVDIYPESMFKGSITAIGSMSVSTGTYFPVEISLENSENLASGLSAHAEIKAKGSSHMIVPSSAIVENNGESYLFVIKDGLAKKKMVITGLKNDSKIEIVKGLAGSESVAITNANHLFDDMPVQTVKE